MNNIYLWSEENIEIDDDIMDENIEVSLSLS